MNESVIAWVIYVLAGVGCCAVWWKITRFIQHQSWRDLLRGVVVVLIFTPWFYGETPEYFAPAVVLLLMDLLLDGTSGNMNGGIALLFSTFLMLCVLTGRIVMASIRRRKEPA